MPNDKGCRLIAKDRPQFRFEKSEIEITMEMLGVEVDFAPKGHCEISGRGVEHLWDFSKTLFRKDNATLNNDKRANDLKQRLCNIIENTPIEIFQRCSRRCRENELSCCALLEKNPDNEGLKLNDIEKTKKEIENKRCAMDQDYSLVKQLAETVEKKVVDCKMIDVMKFEIAENKKEEDNIKKCPFSPV